MELKKCPYCGKNNLVHAETCKYCSKSFEQQEQGVSIEAPIVNTQEQSGQPQPVSISPLVLNNDQRKQPRSNYTKIIMIISAVIVVMIIAGLSVPLLLNKNESVVRIADSELLGKQNVVPQQEIVKSNNGNLTKNSSPTITVSKSLKGNVGKLEAIYSLSWYSDGTINGTYKYTSRSNIEYTLQGRDLKNGNIELTEYTGSNISAKCNLTMQNNCYVGKMNNTDGRLLNMTMREVFESTKNVSLTNSNIPGIFSQASQRLLTYTDINGLSKQDLKIMRNEIYARHGYIFKTSEMKSYFSRQSWYKGQHDDVSTLLSDIENKNIALIKSYE